MDHSISTMKNTNLFNQNELQTIGVFYYENKKEYTDDCRVPFRELRDIIK